MNDSPVGCQSRAVTEPQREGDREAVEGVAGSRDKAIEKPYSCFVSLVFLYDKTETYR